MIRSPEQQFAFAKRLPIQELAKVLQGQSDVVDMSIAEMVLRQKTQAQKAQQGMAAQQMAQSPKVVEKDLMEAKQIMQPAMDQGVAALPVGGIGEIGNYTGAGGGIVAFDDGGSVQHYQNQGMVRSPMERRGYSVFDLQNIAPTLKAGFESMFPAEDVEAVRLREQIREKMAGRGGPYAAFKPQTDEEMRANIQLNARLNTMSLAELRALAKNVATTTSTGAPTPVLAPVPFKQGEAGEIRKSDAEKGGVNAPNEPAQTPPYIPRDMRMSNIAAAPVAPSDMGRPNYTVLRTDAENIASTLMGQRPVAPTTEQQFQKVRDIYSRAGVDLDLFKKQAIELEKEKGDTKLDRKEMANLRLLEAGLGILGGESPYAFVNIGKGATPALKGLQEDIKDLRKLERDRKKEIRNLQVAQNQMAAGVGKDVSDQIARAEQRLDNYDKEGREIRGSIFNTLTNSDTQRRVAEYNAKVQFGIATLPGQTERIIQRSMEDPTYASFAEKFVGRGGADAMRDIVEYYAKNPLALERLRDSKDPQDVALYNSIKARLGAMSVPSASGRPTGTVRE